MDTESDRTIEATVSADLAMFAMLEGTRPPHLEQIDHGGALPELPVHLINLYGAEAAGRRIVTELAEMIRQSFRATHRPSLRAAG